MLREGTGIVLTRRREGEGDALVTLLLESGETLRVKVHGILVSKNRSRLIAEPGTLVRVIVYEKEPGRGSLKEGSVLERFDEIKESYGEMLLLSHLLELAAQVYGDQESGQELYLLVKGALETLRKRKREASLSRQWLQHFLLFYGIRILKLSGLVGDLTRCSLCDSPLEEKAHLDSELLSFQCHRCSGSATREEYRMAELFHDAGRMRFGRWMERSFREEELVNQSRQVIQRSLEREFERFKISFQELERYLPHGVNES